MMTSLLSSVKPLCPASRSLDAHFQRGLAHFSLTLFAHIIPPAKSFAYKQIFSLGSQIEKSLCELAKNIGQISS